jgi:ketosteroid isomerase-like protein
MYSWLIGRYIRRQIRRMLAGDVGAVTAMLSERAEFVFPGDSSFSGTFRGKSEIEAWIRRFVDLHPDYIVRDVLVSGPPWNLRIAWRLSDRIGRHYANEGMVYTRGAWGKVLSERVFLDTQVLSTWEREHPEEAGRELAAR